MDNERFREMLDEMYYRRLSGLDDVDDASSDADELEDSVPTSSQARAAAAAALEEMESRLAAASAASLAAWREANPEGLIGRLVELHQRNRGLALVLARYAEPHGYEGLADDVAAWPVVHRPSRLRIAYPDMPPDRTLCPVCGGWGRVAPRDIGESLADALEKFPEFGLEEALEEIPCPACEGWGEVPIGPQSPCPSCSGSGRWGDDIPCGRCGGRGFYE